MNAPNIIIKNLFTDDEYKQLYDFVLENYKNTESLDVKVEDLWNEKYIDKVRVEPYTGRARLDFAPRNKFLSLPENIVDKVIKIAKEYYPDCNFGSCFFVEYSKKFGEPALSPHVDSHSGTFTIDFQLSSNKNWPIYVENKEFVLENNDALLMNTGTQVHWRIPQKFKESDFVYMIFFHFDVTKENLMTRKERVEYAKPWHDIYKKQMNDMKRQGEHND